MGYIAGHEPRIMHEEILVELEKARRKFPTQDVWVTLAALTEEVGELNQAILQHHFEPAKDITIAAIRKEAVQVACMAMRVILDTEVGLPTANDPTGMPQKGDKLLDQAKERLHNQSSDPF